MHAFKSLDEVQDWAFRGLLRDGASVQPRGLRTRELMGVAFQLEDPRRRCLTSATRGWSLPLALGEFAWHVSASTDVRALAYYAPAWRRFAEDGANIRGGCYGHRVFARAGENPSQWDRVLQILRADEHSRRAVLTLGDPQYVLDPARVDVSCACTLQFLVRNGQLHAFATMRSNDVVWGLPYDVFLFTMLQELAAVELGLGLGTYTHFAASFHIYEKHIELAEKTLAARDWFGFEMPPMGRLNELPAFVEAEKQIRGGDASQRVSWATESSYWLELAQVLEWFSNRHGTENIKYEPSRYSKLLWASPVSRVKD